MASHARVQFGEGSIDHAAISANGTKVAWTQRGGPLGDEVVVVQAAVSSAGKVTIEN